MSRIVKFSAACAAAALLLTGCAGGGSDKASEGGSDSAPEKLVIATGEPAYEPWFVDNDPASGKGFESAVAYAVAEKMGYSKDQVEWVRETFEASIAPGDKAWDLNIQQFSITEDRKKAVDFSLPYYSTTQAVVAAADSDAAKAKSLSDLSKATIGAAAGTTSVTVAEELIPGANLQIFNSVDDAVAALQAGNIDALVTDLPGAFYVRDAQLEGKGVIVGQLVTDNAKGDEFAFVLPKGSELKAKVDKAIEELRGDGTLEELTDKWLAGQGAPVLK